MDKIYIKGASVAGSRIFKVGILSLFLITCATVGLWARDLAGVTQEAEDIFKEQQQSSNPIPLGALVNAKGIGIIKVYEGGIGIGGSGGEGVILERTATGWSAPVFFHQGGGTAGFQFGVHGKNYIYLFNSEDPIQVFTGPKASQFKSLAQYTSTDLHESEIAIDGLSRPDVLVYGSAKGFYGGATIGNSLVSGSVGANQKAYGTDDANKIFTSNTPVPDYAQPLVDLLNKSISLHGTAKDK